MARKNNSKISNDIENAEDTKTSNGIENAEDTKTSNGIETTTDEKHTWKKIAAFAVALLLAGIAVACVIYVNTYYKADDVSRYMLSDANVKVVETKDYIMFDGPGTENALIFYQGAKVDENAYAPLMRELAEEGIDCFLLEIPCKIAFLGQNMPDEILNKYDYANYYAGGHSLGGVVASMYVKNHTDKFKGIVLLASYSTKDFSDTSIKAISVYGTEDEVLDSDSYSEHVSKFNPNLFYEDVIDGGNHSGFAYYGPQKGDGEATITKDEQIEETVSFICEHIL